MPLTLTWMDALVLVADGFLIGLGWIIVGAIYSGLIALLSRGRAP